MATKQMAETKGDGRQPYVGDLRTPIHPGEILSAEFLLPMGLTQYRLAQALHVPQIRVSEIVRGRRAITADTALRLARFFGTSAQFWLGLQEQYDLDVARDALGAALQEVEVYAG